MATGAINTALDFGDTLLLAGGWANIQRLGKVERENFVILTLPAEYDELRPARRQAPVGGNLLLRCLRDARILSGEYAGGGARRLLLPRFRKGGITSAAANYACYCRTGSGDISPSRHLISGQG